MSDEVKMPEPTAFGVTHLGAMWDRFIAAISGEDRIAYKNLIGSAPTYRDRFIAANIQNVGVFTLDQLTAYAEARVAQERERIAELRDVMKLAYGHLWHVNVEPLAPIPLRSPEGASYAARKLLLSAITIEEQGEGIRRVDELLGAAAIREGKPGTVQPKTPVK